MKKNIEYIFVYNGRRYLIIDLHFNYSQKQEDRSGKPVTVPWHSPILLYLRPMGKNKDRELVQQYVSKRLFEGHIEFLIVEDGIENRLMRHLEFANAKLSRFGIATKYPGHEGKDLLRIEISPYIVKHGDTITEWPCNPSNPFRERTTLVLSRADFEEETDAGESEYTLESTYVHDHFMTIAKAIATEFEEDNENALYQVYRSMATGAISNPPIEVRTDAHTFVKYDSNNEKIIVREEDLKGIQQDNTKKLKLLRALTEAYGKHLNRQFPNEKSAIPSNSILKFDGIANKTLSFGTLTSPDYTGALTVDVNASSTDWACLVLDFGYTSKGVQANAYIGTSTAKAKAIIPMIHRDLGYFGYITKNTTNSHTKDLDSIVAQWLEKETKVDPVREGNIESGIRYKVDTVEFMLMMQLRTYILNAFGNTTVLELLNNLETSKHSVVILQDNGSNTLSGSTVSRSVNIYEEGLEPQGSIEEPDYPLVRSAKNLKEYNEKYKLYEEETERMKVQRKANKPDFHCKKGIGDSSIIRLKGDEGTTPSKDTREKLEKYNIKRTDLTVLLHEYYHAWRMAKGLIKEIEVEEVKATQFVNENLRSKHNRRPFYDTLEVPLEEKYKN